MNKRFALALTAILCAIAICAAMIPALSVFADDEVNYEDATPIEGITATCTDPFHVTGYWHIDYLFDSTDSYMGWHASADGSNFPTVDTPTVITADLNGYYDVYFVAIYPMDHTGIYTGTPSLMPSAFTLELSTDNGATWIPVAADTDVNCTLEDDPLIYILPELGVDPVMGATNFRMTITAPGNNDLYPNAHCTGIGNIEIYGFEAEAPAPAETETQAPAVTETQAPSVTETEAPEETVVETVVESAVEEDSADESEEIVEESAEESADESANETVVDETVVETVAGETTADTTAATDAPAADAEEGCASVVGFGAVAVLAAAAAFVFKKKD